MRTTQTDILIIGGGPAALVTAATALENYPDKKITLIKQEEVGLVPCGIPYIFGETLGSSDKNAMPCGGPLADKITIVVDEVLSIDVKNKEILASQNKINFEKLVLATGSIPFVHKSFENALKLENVFTIDKDKERIDKIVEYLKEKQKVIVIGTGFIGVEMATELRSSGKSVSIIGGKQHVLAGSFDEELALEAEDIMKEMAIDLVLGQHASNIIEENGKAVGVKLCDGTVIDGDVIILATGYQPNTSLAKEAGLKIARYGGVWVDEYMRTRDKDIFAVGDCCGRRDFITRDPSKVMLASTSASEARVAGNSLYKIKYLKGFSGT
ncbi:MAG: FAD-dependent oxidoreductase, partial [Campylobacterota bacterium]|nr:FAD-dependent oxidoreductase [Campylobacterota bacterium]